MKSKLYVIFILSGFLITTAFPPVYAGMDVNGGDDSAVTAPAKNLKKTVNKPWWRKKLISAFYCMQMTPTGRFFWNYGLKNGLKQVLFSNAGDIYVFKNGQFWMDWEIAPAWPHYISYIMVQGFVRFQQSVIIKKYGSPKIGNLVELDQWAVLMAMRHWDKLKAPSGRTMEELDFDSPLTCARDAKVYFFYGTWKRDIDEFLKLTADRHKRLNSDSITIEEYLKNPQLPVNARNAVLALRRTWESILSGERDLRNKSAGALHLSTGTSGPAKKTGQPPLAGAPPENSFSFKAPEDSSVLRELLSIRDGSSSFH